MNATGPSDQMPGTAGQRKNLTHMHKRKKTTIRLLACLAALLVLTQVSAGEPSRLRISLLTCSPGDELYSTFGHNALRIVDSAAGTDIVYNFGVFDFYDPNFYMKFVRGKLLYMLDQEHFGDFLYNYTMEDRSVSEQLLNLDPTEKQKLQEFLFNNLRPENKYYKYDFLFDNCSTRLRDLVLEKQGRSAVTASILSEPGRTFRNHIHYYLNKNGMHWAKLGIDILLGSRLDRPMTNREAMFLPDYLEKGFDSSALGSEMLVTEKITLYKKSKEPDTSKRLPPPTVLAFSAFLAAMLLLSIFKSAWATRLLALGDFLLFFLTGVIGILLLFMWTATDHQICRDNYNLLWALPTHFLAAFFIRSDKPIARLYFQAVVFLSAALLMAWFFLPQEMNPAMLPLVFAIGWRSYRISRMQVK